MSVYLSHLTVRLVWHVRHKLCHTCLSTCLIWLSDCLTRLTCPSYVMSYISVYLSHLTVWFVWHVHHMLCHTCLSICLIWLSDSADMSVICYVIRHMSSYVRYVLSCLETYFNRHNSSVISVMLCLVCLSVLSVIQLSVYVYMNSYIYVCIKVALLG